MKKAFRTIKKTIKNYRPPKSIILALFAVMSIYVFFQKNTFDNDTWFLLNHGRYIFKNGIPHIEPFTIHQGFKFVMQQWLTSCIFWFVYKRFKILGLKILVTFVYSLTMYFMYKLCMLVSNKKFYLSSFITIVFSLLLQIQTVLRPQIFDSLIFVIELYVLELYIRKKRNKYLLVLPILSLLLINLHSSMWFMLIAFMVPYIIDSFKLNIKFIKGEGYKKRPLFIVLFVVLLVGFLNPYGLEAITYVFRSYGIKEINSFILEMKPIAITRFSGKIVFGILFFVISTAIFSKNRKIKLRYYLLFLGTSFLGLSQVKSLYLLLIGVFFPIADLLSEEFKEYYTKYHKLKFIIIQRTIVVLMIIIVGLVLYKPLKQPVAKVSDSVNYIMNNYDITKIKVYTSYGDGSYTEFMGLRCYIDPRAEVFLKTNNKKADVFYEYYELQTVKTEGYEFLEKYKFDLLILDKKDALNMYKDRFYKLVYNDENREVYELKKE